MKNSILALASLFIAAPAFAHIEPGLWKGTSPDGSECSIQVFEQTFENNMHHPLNERIRVQVKGDEFQIYHPRGITQDKAKVQFNHDFFEGILATPVGANAIVIDMLHSEEFEGPTGFRWISDNWKTKQSTTLTCEKLKHVGAL